MGSNLNLMWFVFGVLIIGLMALDLGVFNRKAHVVKFKEALIFSLGWILLALIFNGFVWYEMGSQKALEFLTGYIIEESLSVDNLFVFIVIFSYFKIASVYHHRVLFWGILGAIIMRALFIASGVSMINRFSWVLYVFGAFLVFTGIKMLFYKEREIHPERNPLVSIFRRFIPTCTEFEGQSFFTRHEGRLCATPLLIVLLVVESSDVMFAVDSIPAIFAVTNDPFIIYTSNIFAILGLRSLYFLLAGMMDRFMYLKVGLSFVLAFIGVKMLIAEFYKIPIAISLGVVMVMLAASVIVSLLKSKSTIHTLSQ